jgi:hypothetical protein
VLETILEVILLKPIQLFFRILNDISSVTKTVFSALISVQGAVKDQLDPRQEIMGDAAVLFAKKSWTKPDRCTGALL